MNDSVSCAPNGSPGQNDLLHNARKLSPELDLFLDALHEAGIDYVVKGSSLHFDDAKERELVANLAEQHAFYLADDNTVLFVMRSSPAPVKRQLAADSSEGFQP